YGKSNGWLDGQPAAITRKVGKGRITYIGAWLDPKTMENAAKWMAASTGVEVSVRQGAHGPVFILVNLSKQPQTISLPGPMSDVLEGVSKSSVDLPVYGVAVLAPPH